jgi:hypothetical protein
VTWLFTSSSSFAAVTSVWASARRVASAGPAGWVVGGGLGSAVAVAGPVRATAMASAINGRR